MRNALTLSLIVLSVVTAVPSYADTAATLADGATWTMRDADGRDGTITFNPDGSTLMKMGPFSMNGSWTLQGETLCITGRRGDTRCADLVPVANGFAGERNGEAVLRLTR